MVKQIVTFVSGVLLGAGCGIIFTKKKYENKANDEIARIRELYSQAIAAENNVEVAPENTVAEEQVAPTADALKKEERVDIRETDYTKFYSTSAVDIHEIKEQPQAQPPVIRSADFSIISRDEFKSIPDYEYDSLYLHSDGIWTNSDIEMVPDITVIFPPDVIDYLETTLNEKNDTCYVRSMRDMMDYIVLYDEDSFEDTEYYDTVGDDDDEIDGFTSD